MILNNGSDKAIIDPIKGKKAPCLGPFAVMVTSAEELAFIKNHMKIEWEKKDLKNVMMSRIHIDSSSSPRFSLAGPVVGAPYAAMIIETLICWGAKEIVYFGWCGSISPDTKIGDIIIADGAIIDEGTSPGYGGKMLGNVFSHPDLKDKIEKAFIEEKTNFHNGLIWTTDAIYRETPAKMEYFRKRNAIGVEMEASALFTIGKFRNVKTAAILVVSDELATGKWVPGFHHDEFKHSRQAISKIIKKLCLRA